MLTTAQAHEVNIYLITSHTEWSLVSSQCDNILELGMEEAKQFLLNFV